MPVCVTGPGPGGNAIETDSTAAPLNGPTGASSRARRRRGIAWALLLIVLVVGADQLSKFAAKRYLEGEGTVPVVGSVLVLRYVQNEGAFLSLGSRWPPTVRFVVFTVATAAAVVALTVYLLLSHGLQALQRMSLACIIGGGVGNLIDRIAYDGSVIDFMNLGLGRLRTGIFNTADVAVLVGAVLLLLAPLRRQRGDGTAEEKENRT
jgi:signal peptidase II